MRCKNCNYLLENLTQRRCPECGTPFDPDDAIEDYSPVAPLLPRSHVVALALLSLAAPILIDMLLPLLAPDRWRMSDHPWKYLPTAIFFFPITFACAIVLYLVVRRGVRLLMKLVGNRPT